MDIKNITEFAGYCHDATDPEALQTMLTYADQLTSICVDAQRQYGGDINENLNFAFRELTKRGVEPDSKTLNQTHEVLTQFWTHGEAFDTWFKSKVIIVNP